MPPTQSVNYYNARDCFLLYIHIMENILCAKLLALDRLILTLFVTISQLWGHSGVQLSLFNVYHNIKVKVPLLLFIRESVCSDCVTFQLFMLLVT